MSFSSPFFLPCLTPVAQSACTEMILELNHCVEVRPQATLRVTIRSCPRQRRCFSYGDQEILRANASVKVAADLATKYRKNVQYNLEATKQEFKP